FHKRVVEQQEREQQSQSTVKGLELKETTNSGVSQQTLISNSSEGLGIQNETIQYEVETQQAETLVGSMDNVEAESYSLTQNPIVQS
ncbi:MAG: hypothetical protein EZS28_028117, partial [Streblomastix strix]